MTWSEDYERRVLRMRERYALNPTSNPHAATGFAMELFHRWARQHAKGEVWLHPYKPYDPQGLLAGGYSHRMDAALHEVQRRYGDAYTNRHIDERCRPDPRYRAWVGGRLLWKWEDFASDSEWDDFVNRQRREFPTKAARCAWGALANAYRSTFDEALR